MTEIRYSPSPSRSMVPNTNPPAHIVRSRTLHKDVAIGFVVLATVDEPAWRTDLYLSHGCALPYLKFTRIRFEFLAEIK